MRYFSFKLISVLVVSLLLGAATILHAAENPLMPKADIKKKNDTIQVTHHVVWIMALLKNNNHSVDSRDLELLYNQLLPENVSFDSLNEDTLNYVTNAIKKINSLRIDAGERQVLQEVYDAEKTKAIWACLPNNMAVIVDANWKQVIANVAQTVFYSFMNYQNIKNTLAIQYRKDTWALDKQRLNDVTDENIRDFQALFDIFKKNGILDREIVKNAVKLFNKVVETEFGSTQDIATRFRVWRDLKNEVFQKEYENFALYWFYRGILAYYYSDQNQPLEIKNLAFHKDSDLIDADFCFKKYQELTKTPALTKDPIVAEVAARRIQLAMNSNIPDKKLLKKQLELIIEHSQNDKDYERYIFCGLVYYYYLNNYDAAYKMFQCAESILATKYNKDFKDFLKVLELDNEYDIKEKYGITGKYIEEYVETVIGKNSDGTDDIEKIKKEIFLPSNDLLFFTRMAMYHSMILAGKDKKLAEEINKTISSIYSPLTTLFYGANVREEKTRKKYYKEILPKVFGVPAPSEESLSKPWNLLFEPVGKYPLPFNVKHICYIWRCGQDNFYVRMPLQFAVLQNIEYTMEVQLKNGKTVPMQRDKANDRLVTVTDSTLTNIYNYFYKDRKFIKIKKEILPELPLEASENDCIEKIFGTEGNRVKWSKYYNTLTQIGASTVDVLFAFLFEEDYLTAEAQYIIFRAKHKLFEYVVKYDISSRKGKAHGKEYYNNLPGNVYFILNKNNIEKIKRK